MQAPLNMAKLRVSSKDALAFLNGNWRPPRRTGVRVPLVIGLVLLGLGLGILLRLFPDIRRYMDMRKM